MKPKNLYPFVPSHSGYTSPAKKCQMVIRNTFGRLVKPQRRTRGTFMSALSNKSSSHHRCVEAALLFSAVAQRLE